ncbi:MAG: PIN domain-containing protein [Calditrichaeota bacterium]|nr:MAG: PIN domain-containing protein [Calditrichota bacterium]
MIVVDTNIIAYLLIPGKKTAEAEKVFKRDSQWSSSRLWRSEFRNVLINYLRHEYIDLIQAFDIMNKAELLMKGREFEVPSPAILSTSFNSKCNAYDCEFVVLAKELGVKLITTDKLVLREFPAASISIDAYLSNN